MSQKIIVLVLNNLSNQMNIIKMVRLKKESFSLEFSYVYICYINMKKSFRSFKKRQNPIFSIGCHMYLMQSIP